MSQQQWAILAFRIVLISGFISLVAWIAIYSAMAEWWKSAIGRTLVAKTVLIALMFIPSILALFFKLNRADSYIAGWVDVTLIGLVTPVMWWRTIVWLKISRSDRRGDGLDPPGGSLLSA